jgi:hypothetical protein
MTTTSKGLQITKRLVVFGAAPLGREHCFNTAVPSHVNGPGFLKPDGIALNREHQLVASREPEFIANLFG